MIPSKETDYRFKLQGNHLDQTFFFSLKLSIHKVNQ